jgi:hypothetical protein
VVPKHPHGGASSGGGIGSFFGDCD